MDQNVLNKINQLKDEINFLKKQLECKETELRNLVSDADCPYSLGLATEEISLYSRQMILPEFGLTGQIKLKKAKVLIVGIGGLGCPAALYLTAAGVGEITLIDYDTVEITNLHRQILHNYNSLGDKKVISAARFLKSLNRNVKIIPICKPADSSTLTMLFSENKYDVVIDGSDNSPTRYLLNDICVFNNVPLVSGSALQMDGQLTVYNYQNGPCYRCLFPIPPPPEAVTNCGDGGVLGVVPGVIGVMQALETIKIIAEIGNVLSQRLLVFDATAGTFMNIKLRGKKQDCAVCGSNPTITSPIDYERFCRSKAHDKIIDINVLNSKENVDVKSFAKKLKEDRLIIDVRPKNEYEMCKLPNTLNIPYADLIKDKTKEVVLEIKKLGKHQDVYLLCRRGNDSQRAALHLKQTFPDQNCNFINVSGGLNAFSKYVDSSFPVY